MSSFVKAVTLVTLKLLWTHFTLAGWKTGFGKSGCIWHHAILRNSLWLTWKFCTWNIFWAGLFKSSQSWFFFKPAAVVESPLTPCSAAGLNVGQGSPLPSPPSATSLLSCLIQSKLACWGLFSYRYPIKQRLLCWSSSESQHCREHNSVHVKLTQTLVPCSSFTSTQFWSWYAWAQHWFWHHCCGDMMACRCSVWISLQCFLLILSLQYVICANTLFNTFLELMGYFCFPSDFHATAAMLFSSCALL